MYYLLIDTCSWIDILTADRKNELLPQLEFWINNKYIKLITHEVIIEEWNNHKEEKRSQITQSLRDKYKHAKEVLKLEKLGIPLDLEPNFSNLEKQIASIDSMLQHAIILSTSNQTKAFCIDRTIVPRKAPFHNNKFSTKDAYIIFSALNYFKKIKQDFIFISSNKNDFGSPDNLEREIHNEIVEKYAKTKVEYYSEIGRAINNLKKKMPASLMPSEESNLKDISKVDEITIDKSKSILDQLFEYITIRFSEINFIPIHILTRHYPFKKNPESFPIYSLFSLTIDNESLLELFDSFKITDSGEIEYTRDSFFKDTLEYNSKLKTILRKLTSNLIFYVYDRSSSKKSKIHFLEKEICNCPKCNFNKLKFTETFEKLSQAIGELKDLMKFAFIEYQLGDFVKSAELFKRSLSIAIEKGQNSNAFISQFNLFKLGIFIRNNYWGDFSHDDLWKELRQINLNDSIKKFGTETNIGLLDWIKDTSFYSDIRDSIHGTVSKIIDHYYSYQKGGWSVNSEVWKLINDYAEIEYFLSENYIIFDKYTEFKDLTNVFTEGLFASYAIQDSHSSRLDTFDDWILSKLIFYGSADSINKYYARYKPKKLKYSESSKNEDTFIDLINNFFDNKKLNDSFLTYCELGNRTFWDYYNTLFCNILTLLSIIDLKDEYINNFTLKLLEVLSEETFILSYNLKYVRIYFIRVGEKINSACLEKLFLISIANPKYHEERFFEAISDIASKKKIQIKVSVNTFSSIKKMAFEKCELCKTKHAPSIVLPIYAVLKSKKYKSEIVTLVNNSLNERFDFEFYYLATIFDVISYNDSHLTKSIDVVLSEKDNLSFKSAISGNKEKRIPKLNELINLCFKFNINTREEKFTKLKSLDDYYDWLLDMKNFDYRKFHPKWIMEYPTKYYYKKINESSKTKKATENYLKNTHDNELQNTYFDIFINGPRKLT